MRGKQIDKVSTAPIVSADVTGASAGTLGAYLNTMSLGATKTVAYPAIAASTDGVKATNSTLADIPKSLPQISVGADFKGFVGDGTKVSVPFYFSGDNGTTAKTLAAMVVGDNLYVNVSVLGYVLDVNDTLYNTYRA